VLEELYVTDKDYNTDFASASWWAAERTWTDHMMACPSQYATQQLGLLSTRQEGDRARKSSTYFYHFEHQPRNAPLTRHVSDIPYVFHQSELLGHTDDRDMADIMSTYWGNFFATGNPNEGSSNSLQVPFFYSYNPTNDNCNILLNASCITQTAHLKESECGFFIPRTDTAIRSAFPPPVARERLGGRG
jgi:hypothetical protein